MYSRFQEINYGYRNVLLRSVRYNAVFFPIIEIFSALTIGLLLLVRRWIDSAADYSGGRHRCLHPVYSTHVPAHSRLGREI